MVYMLMGGVEVSGEHHRDCLVNLNSTTRLEVKPVPPTTFQMVGIWVLQKRSGIGCMGWWAMKKAFIIEAGIWAKAHAQHGQFGRATWDAFMPMKLFHTKGSFKRPAVQDFRMDCNEYYVDPTDTAAVAQPVQTGMECWTLTGFMEGSAQAAYPNSSRFTRSISFL